MINKILFSLLFCSSLLGTEHVFLKTPHVSRDCVTGAAVGVRPFRKTGVRLESEMILDKLVIHNYGYGDSGLTLCFGGSHEVVDMLNTYNVSHEQVAILGAGVIGLATAYDLLDQGYDVHIYADNWSPDLTSNIGAGIWSPLAYPCSLTEEQKWLHQRLAEISQARFFNSLDCCPEFEGIRPIHSYSFKKELSQEVIKTKHKGEEIIAHFDNGVIKRGRKTTEISIDSMKFVQDLFAKVKKKGAKIHTQHFCDLYEVMQLEEPIIINCTSLGSRTLFNDKDFIPAKGHLVYFQPQSGVDYVFYQNVPEDMNYWVSICPWSDRMILGGVYEYDRDDLDMDPEAINKIIENAKKCFCEDIL